MNDLEVETVRNNPEKFLGSLITFTMQTSDAFNLAKEKLQNVLSNIDKCFIRDEYKVAIFTRYSLPSLRYLLSVHDLTGTQLDGLDSVATRYMKKWLNVPSHGASSANSAFLFSPDGLQFKLPSQMYKESHVLTHASSRVRADIKVQKALDAKVAREAQWSRKMSKCNASICENYLPDVPMPSWQMTKVSVVQTLRSEEKSFWREKIAPLVMQGDFLIKLLEIENGDLTWRSIIYSLPRGVLSFITRAAINCLPTADNLRRWGEKLNSRCFLCGNHETLLHILNNCSKALNQGRYNYRHDSVLTYIATTCEQLQNNIEMYIDIQGHKINGGTLPPDIVVTSNRPDIVLVDRDNKEILLAELTCPFETNIDNANARKTDKYSPLQSDIASNGYKCRLICFEVGSRGLITKYNKKRLSEIIRFVKRGEKNERPLSKVVKTVSLSIIRNL